MVRTNDNSQCTEEQVTKVLNYVQKLGKEGVMVESIERIAIDGRENTILTKTYGKSADDNATVIITIPHYLPDVSILDIYTNVNKAPVSIYLNKWDLKVVTESSDENEKIVDLLCQIEHNKSLKEFVKTTKKKPLFELFFEEN